MYVCSHKCVHVSVCLQAKGLQWGPLGFLFLGLGPEASLAPTLFDKGCRDSVLHTCIIQGPPEE